jgi:hypothetical protein
MTFPPHDQAPASPAPGWWLASNGHWYPPGIRKPSIPPAPASAVPHTDAHASAPPTIKTTPPSDFVSSPRTARRAAPRTPVVLAVAGVLLLGSTVYALARTTPTSSPTSAAAAAAASGPGHGLNASPSAGSPTTTPAGAAALAAHVGLQPGDLPSGWSAVPNTGGAQSPSAPGPCSPISSAPWLADVSSPDYQSTTDWTAFSVVVVMPDAAHAQAALQAIDAPGYATTCFQSAWDQWAKQAIADTSGQTACDLTFVGSSIGPIPAASVPRGVSGAAGVEYQAKVTCPTEGTSTVLRDEISVAVGNLFIQEQFLGPAGAPTLSESSALADMARRAEQAVGNP